MNKLFSISFLFYIISIFGAESITFQGLVIQSNVSGQGIVKLFRNGKKENSFNYYGINGGLSCDYPHVFEEEKNTRQREFFIINEDQEKGRIFNVQNIQVFSSEIENLQTTISSETLVKYI
jgi:hypothetical protein